MSYEGIVEFILLLLAALRELLAVERVPVPASDRWGGVSAIGATLAGVGTIALVAVAYFQLRGLRNDSQAERDERADELATLREQLDASSTQNELLVKAMVRPMVAVPWARVAANGQLNAPVKNVGVGPALRITASGWLRSRRSGVPEPQGSPAEIVGRIGEDLRASGPPRWTLIGGVIGIGESVYHWHPTPGSSGPITLGEAVFAWRIEYFDVDDRHYLAEGEDAFFVGQGPPRDS